MFSWTFLLFGGDQCNRYPLPLMLPLCAHKPQYHVLTTESGVSDEERLEGLVKNKTKCKEKKKKLSCMKYQWKLASRKVRAKDVVDHLTAWE